MRFALAVIITLSSFARADAQHTPTMWRGPIVPQQPEIPQPKESHVSDKVMRLLLSNADFVTLGEIDSVSNGIAHEAATHFSWGCKVRVLNVIKGRRPESDIVNVSVDVLTDHPFFMPKKGDKWVFFLNEVGLIKSPDYVTDDLYFSVQPASMAHALTREYKQMIGAERGDTTTR